jgi:hypothetical protein
MASLGARGFSRVGTEKGPLSPIPNGRNGWLEGLRLAQEHKRGEKMGPYRKSRLAEYVGRGYRPNKIEN